ncbi:MAG: phage shock protein operon transcriptional activator [Desulfovibrionaceae bacterium]
MQDHHPAAPLEALGQSEPFLAFQEALSRASRADRPVCIVGERGTGKELAAARLHYLSRRWDGPYVVCNCAALAPSLVEAELFGHEAGAFTGAGARRAGRFEAAHTGTLFLDEIAAMPLAVQEKILRVVEYGEFERVGGVGPVLVDVRVVAAANEDLPGLAARGRFRADLLDRLSFEVLTLPPLRARAGDVPLLAAYFAARMAGELGLAETPRFSSAAMAALCGHGWPGNVRELKNVVERAVHRWDPDEEEMVASVVFDPFASPFRPAPPDGRTHAWAGEPTTGPGSGPDGGLDSGPDRGPDSGQATGLGASPVFDVQAGSPGVVGDAVAALASLPLREAMERLECAALRNALARTRHNQRRAADLLGLTYNQFRGLYRKHRSAMDS